jgi:hypothetical protein
MTRCNKYRFCVEQSQVGTDNAQGYNIYTVHAGRQFTNATVDVKGGPYGPNLNIRQGVKKPEAQRESRSNEHTRLPQQFPHLRGVRFHLPL